MVSASGAISAASVAVLLLESRSLASTIQPRNKRCLSLQLRLAVLLFCARRTWERLAELKWPEKAVAKRVPSVHALVLQILDFCRQPLGAVATGMVVPFALAASGLASLWAKKPAQQVYHQKWLGRVLAFSSVPTLVDAVEERFGEEVDVIAVLAFELGLLMGEHAAAAVILLMLTGGEALEHYTFSRARATLACVMDESNPVAHRLSPPCSPSKPKSSEEQFNRAASPTRSFASEESSDDGSNASPTFFLRRLASEVELEDIDVGEIQGGDVLAVRAGEMVPVDGTCVAGPGSKQRKLKSLVEEGLLTGEGGDTIKHSKDILLSGSIAKTPLWMRATSRFEGSTLELMRRSLQDAMERKGQVAHHSARAASLMQPLTLVAAALSVAVFWRNQSPQRRWSTALSVLMAATPCPASIGVPVAFLSGMSVAAHHSVLIKSGAAIEAISLATHVVLDKTGTLTMGKPEVMTFEVFEEHVSSAWTSQDTTNYALQILVSVEVLASHPLASALCRYGAERGVTPLPAKATECVPSCGMFSIVDGHRVVLGTRAFLKEKGYKVSLKVPDVRLEDVPTDEAYPCGGSTGESPAWMETHFIIEGLCSGRAAFEDILRPGTAAAVRRLQDLGLHVSILSGDRSAHLRAVADLVGVSDSQGGLLPHEKAQRIEEISAVSETRHVIMIGDESNDAPALAAAHVGIAVGTQSGLASQSADVVVGAEASASPLARVAQLVILCRVIVGTARRGVNCGLGLSAIQVAAAAAGLLAPRTNAVLQELVDVSALANAASVLRHRWQ